MLRPILASVLLFACAREAVRGDLVTTYRALFNDRVDITVPGYCGGTNKLIGFPLLVRLSEGNPVGFTYRRVDASGQDLRFLYSAGGASPVAVPYEVDTWDTNGTSFVWVRLPSVNNNAATKLTMYWAPDDPGGLPANAPATVWADYSAVWHMGGAKDSSTNGVAATAGAEAVSARAGVIGSALGAAGAGSAGPFLSVSSGTALDAMTLGAYTVTGWLRANPSAGATWLYSARTSPTADAFGVALVSDSGVKLRLHSDASTSDTSTKSFAAGQWVHLAVVHEGASGRHRVYCNGTEFYYPTNGRTDKPGDGLALGGLVGAGTAGTLDGDLDDVRIYPAELSASWCTNEYAQAVSSGYVSFGSVVSSGKAVYVGGGDSSGSGSGGGDSSGSGSGDGDSPGSGDGSVSRPTHDLGAGNDRILLLNSDTSVSGGEVRAQSYSDSTPGLDRPYWVHDEDSGYDYTSTSPYYNFCGGLRHTYYAADDTRLWDLLDVRYGNTFNNAEQVFWEEGDWEEWYEGLAQDRNYLHWNPKGGRLVDDMGLAAEGWHEYAAQAVLCNSTKASVNSTLYTNGIGTIYFDCVNSHTDDATNGYYQLVVEIATNALSRVSGLPLGEPTDEAIADDETGDPYRWADWKRVRTVARTVCGETMAKPVTNEVLNLGLTAGGSCTNFYRVYVPLNIFGTVRFRILRTTVNPAYTIAKDSRSLILVDNVICSVPEDRILVEPRGSYDKTKKRRETVGCEGAFNPSYPSVGDSEIRARVRTRSRTTGEAAPDGSVSSVTMHYRWRYIDQRETDWLAAEIDPSSLTSVKPIVWPGLPGDLEYWYEAEQSCVFYRYADYSGLGLGLPGYTEEVKTVESRAPTYATAGKDWFTRIRDGKSSCGTIRLFVRKGAAAAVEQVEMSVVRDRTWRGCVLATNAVETGLYFRFECYDRQNDSLSDFQFNTNFWYLDGSADSLPTVGSVVAGTRDDWSRVPCDGATGHVMFQLDESTRALTVVHADWQDFDGWDDADRDYFSGTTTDDATKRGVSADQRKYLCSADGWPEDCSTNSLWIERFAPGSYSGYDFYQPFNSARSPNGFGVGEGMWVCGTYADASTRSGMALQMAGQGRGYVQLTDPIVRPRGLESISFDARIAQTISPDDFAYYEGGLMLDDYTFLTRAAFDYGGNSNFIGNATLSLAAFYRPRTCCYEARWEQLEGAFDEETGELAGPKPCGQRLAIYRWNFQGAEWQATELFAATNSESVASWNVSYSPQAIPTAFSITNGLMPFMIGAYDNEDEDYTVIVAAVHIAGEADPTLNVRGNTAEATMDYLGDEPGWLYVVYRDTSPERLKRGTYGVLASNCEGAFVRPQYHPGIVSWDAPERTYAMDTQVCPGADAAKAAVAQFYAPDDQRVECVQDFADDFWTVPAGRMRSYCELDGHGNYTDFNSLSAAVVTQTVDILTARYGTESWTNVASRTLTDFGKVGARQNAVFDLWSTDDRAVRIQAGGTIRSVRTDVVVDNIQISQWRGEEIGGTNHQSGVAGPTNFVYTYGWVSNGALELSPRRTPDNKPCSLRVPLCDGQGSRNAKRGLGLGSLSIWYTNAQENARLLVQIATNGINELTLLDRTRDAGRDSYKWTTITNWDFSTLPSSGVLSCSPGLHGVVGTMRVIVDPDLRAEVKASTDPDRFGSVSITQAIFRDEPPLDGGCWWGFNIRTLGDYADSERRMYLPDNPYRSFNPAPDEIGRSLALNNSVTEDCDPEEVGAEPNPFCEHMPFLQTPTFTSKVVGEVSFKARKYETEDDSQCAEVTLYGTREQNVAGLKDEEWERLYVFFVSNTVYETYRYKTDGSAAYRAFRFAVTGVTGVKQPGPPPASGDEPVRVLLDDVLVSEAVRARLAFRNVGAFRHDIDKTTQVPNVPSTDEQPLVGEGWGVQAEIYSAMLGEEVDWTNPPRVRLHYYKGVSPWGYSQWQSKSAATSAWLTQATDTNSFYRSSASDSPAAVIPMSSSTEVVQYMLEVVYSVVNAETGNRSEATNWLESADWKVPSWYAPVDYNETYGGGMTSKFAAFAIIDEIAPGWAWINEINLFGAFNSSYVNTDRNRQFVEVVKPVDYDLDGWTLRMLASKSYGSARSEILTNDVAIFGRPGLPSQKKGGASCSYMSFLVVGNPTTTLTGDQYDGPWDNEWTTDNKVFNAGGELGSYYPVAIQLVRPSGVIEHEVAILGTNAFEEVATSIAWQYSSTNLVRQVRASEPKSSIFALPDDNFVAGSDYSHSVGIFGSDAERGKTALCWKNTMKMTPGDLNEGQTISPEYPRPGGELIMVFASVDTSLGHIVQTVGAGTNTTEMQIVAVHRDSKEGLDIRYTVDPWYELGTVRETEAGSPRVPSVAKTGLRQYTVNVAKEATRNVTVVASAAVDSRLREFGLDENNRYTPAVLHWLERHKLADGVTDFYDWQSCEIRLAQFLSLSGNVVTNMTLTQMYWLDMDPTAGEMYFRAGMVRPPSQVVAEQPTYDPQGDPPSVTNLRLGVYMSISNGNGHASYGSKSVWAPYVLRGLGNDELSWHYSPTNSSSAAWTSETFKVTGFLSSGLTRTDDADAWIPLRYFVFWKDSFDSNFESEIDIEDPFSTSSPAYAEGWSRFVDEHEGWKPPVYMSWNIDTRLRPITAEVLAPTNRLTATSTP